VDLGTTKNQINDGTIYMLSNVIVRTGWAGSMMKGTKGLEPMNQYTGLIAL
jgi:hypothetical protein